MKFLLLALAWFSVALGQNLCAMKKILNGVFKASDLGLKCSFAVNVDFASSTVFSVQQYAASDIFVRMDEAQLSTVVLSEKAAYHAKYWLNDEISPSDTVSGGSYFDIQLSSGIYTVFNYSSFRMENLTSELPTGIACNLGSDNGDVQIVITEIQQAVDDCTITQNYYDELEAISVSAVGSVVTLYQSLTMWQAMSAASVDKNVSIAIVDTTAVPKFMFRPDEVSMGYTNAALSKSRSSICFQDVSDGLNGASLVNQPAYGVQITNGGLFTGIGGVPVYLESGNRFQILAGIGVAGSGTSQSAVNRDKSIASIGATSLDTSSIPPITLRLRRSITSSEAQLAAQTVLIQRPLLTTPNSPGVVVVRDVAGIIRAFYVEDGCERGAPDIAKMSSLTSSMFGVSSGDFGTLYTQPGQPYYNVEYLLGGMVSFISSAPLFSSDGDLIGSIGVSGTGAGQGTSNDGELAALAAQAVAAYVDPCASSTGYCDTILPPVVEVNMFDPSEYVGEVVGLSQAAGMIQVMTNYSTSLSSSGCLSVLDAAMYVKAYLCTDDSFVGAADLSVRKAVSAQAFRKASNSDLQGAQLPGGILWKVEVTNGGLFLNAGGATLFNYTGTAVGGVGCAGVGNDADCAFYAVDLWNSAQAPIDDDINTPSSNDDEDNDYKPLLAATITLAILLSATLVALCVVRYRYVKLMSSNADTLKANLV